MNKRHFHDDCGFIKFDICDDRTTKWNSIDRLFSALEEDDGVGDAERQEAR